MLDAGHISRNWLLVANQSDPSLLRNYAALHLGNQLDGMYWTPWARNIHLYVNAEYMGVYLLVDRRDTGPGRLQLTSDADPAVSEYFLEMDWRLCERSGEIEDVTFVRVNSRPEGIANTEAYNRRSHDRDFLWEFSYPGEDIMTPEHVEYVRDFMTRAGQAIRSQDFEAISQIIDVASFVDYYIVYELFLSIDFGMSSMLTQIKGQGDERRLHLGPIWDFDLSAGNRRMTRTTGTVSSYHYWFYNLMQVPEFYDALVRRWNTVARNAIEETIIHVGELAVTYQDAFERNFQRHPILGTEIWGSTPPEIVAIDSFIGNVEYLTNWLMTRAEYMDNWLGRESMLVTIHGNLIALAYGDVIQIIQMPINGNAFLPMAAAANVFAEAFSKILQAES